MASRKTSDGSQKQRSPGAKGSSTNVGGTYAGNVNHPEMANHPETTRQLESVVQLDPKLQLVSAVPETVVQPPSESYSTVAPPPSQQVTLTEMVSTAKGAIPKTPTAQISAKQNKNKRISVPAIITTNAFVRRNPPRRVRETRVRQNPPRRVRKNRVSSCGLCDDPDNIRMVQCDECDSWYHFSCVDVSQSVEEISWSCPRCASEFSIKTPSAVQTGKIATVIQESTKQLSQHNLPPIDAVSVKSTGKSSKRSDKKRIELQLQKLKEERKCQLQYLDQKYSLLQELEGETSSQASDPDSILENASKVQQWIDNTEKCGDDSGLSDADPEDERVPNKSQELQVVRFPPQAPQVGAVNDVEKAQQINNQLIFDRRGPPVVKTDISSRNVQSNRCTLPRPQVGLSDAEGISALTISELWKQWCDRFLPPVDQNRTIDRQIPPINTREEPAPTHRPEVPAPPVSRSIIRTFAEGEFIPGQGSTPVPQTQRRNTPPAVGIEGENTVYLLNRSQLAARQAVSKDLPDFGGTPEDWPLFFSIFNSSTQLCGFSNEENMLRLRKCLKGKALDAVKCRLLHPSNVHGVMATLKMLYGRPETIIQAIVKKIRSLPSPSIERLDTVIQFALNVENLVATVEACEIADFMYNASLRYELVERLPPTLKLDWAKSSRSNPNPNLLDFSSWLRSIAEDASAVSIATGSDHRPRISKRDGYLNLHSEEDYQSPRKPSVSAECSKPTSKEPARECVGCKGNCSTLAQCKRFKDLSYDSRWAVVREFKVCRKCLRRHNGPCKQNKACGVDGCSFLHHSLLHDAKRYSSASSAAPASTPPQHRGDQATNSCNVHQCQSEILFRIVPVVLHGPSKVVQTYAFVDDGSELTLMEDSLARELGVEGPTKSLCLRWTGGTNRMESQSQKVNFYISSVMNPIKKFQLSEVHTVGSLELRPQTLRIPELQEKYRHLQGLPLESYQEVSPRLLIGLDHASLGNVMKCREGKSNEPIAVKTRLGWMIYGRCSRTTNGGSHINHHSIQICQCESKSDKELHEAMKEYFSLESLGISKPNKLLLSNDDQRATELLQTLTRRTNGRYESGLLWRYDNVRLPDSRSMALRRWECLDRRMQKDANLALALNAKVNDYLAKGYIRKLSAKELEMRRDRVWYLPMFPVVNPNKPGKTRLVWDAAATSYGVSLNSVLLKGPDQLTSLLSVLVRFREFRVAVSGDIREMFHQVRMRPEDQHCQRFLWKENEADTAPSTYVMQVMSFGASCSPSTAQYVKNTHAMQFEQEYPKAVHAIVHQHYVDDMLISAETVENAIQLATDVKRIHESGGFEIRNWVSNSSTVGAALDGEETKEKNLSMGDADTTEKVLGMWWNTAADCFTYKLSPRHEADLLSGRKRPTKREVLRTLMMVFDPLGLISHFLMFLRSLLQEIWRASVDWDEQIHDSHFEKWLTWLRVLPRVSDIKIPRCYRITTSAEGTVQMHTLVDASENGFAAVVYLRFQEGSTVDVALAGAKTRVAPLKFLSIPRSELQAAVLGVRLADSILGSLSIKVQKRYFWTDSREVLCWLHSDHRRYSQYVGARISEILETTDLREWRWVPTKLNVADDGTKWKSTPDLSNSSRWFCGPDFLRETENEWPATPQSIAVTDTELRPHLHLHFKVFEPIIDTSRFSKWSILRKTTAYVFRAISNMQRTMRKTSKACGPLTHDELVKAECYLYQIAQRSVYGEELAILSSLRESHGKQIPKNSPLFRVCPFMDEKGLLRVRGRTSACQFIDSSIANPIILPREHSITRLIMLDVHQRFLHQNHETVLNELKQRYYVPRMKSVYKSVRNSCQTCKNERARPQAPLMSNLPPSRLAAYSKPFNHMGVDYFGPMTVSVGRRVEKRWGVLATCLTVRAIHLEVAHSLTTDSCIMALRNVMGRRGVPAAIYSDRGTNFVGANRELQTALEELNHDEIVAEFTSPQTTWSFIPPMSPHMGGSWERLIRTVKQNLEKLLPNRLPSDETLRSTLIEVEYIVNSRPLTDIPLDDDQSPVLTPNHFLIGSSSGVLPWTCFDDSPARQKQNWCLSQSIANRFWKQWLHDYLPSLTRRTKWYKEVKPIKINDVVVIVDNRFPRNCWPKGRVIATKIATDGQVRCATVQTVHGVYERPAVKLAVLDVGVGCNATQKDLRCIKGGSVSCATSTSVPSPPLAESIANCGRT
ncbi:uncharacterized protein LOC128745509 [Sabethes cyaneus]|uniref:uncharacterized protein LOC128745509 n=1 Tax=Sabethes cyaneus TaxID=53552 RepID=UPI00237DE476|nr:uncharacterized protein LOC128745509 [Sabethes cyaneus]